MPITAIIAAIKTDVSISHRVNRLPPRERRMFFILVIVIIIFLVEDNIAHFLEKFYKS